MHKRGKIFVVLLLTLCVQCFSNAAEYRRFQALGNPTEYLFSKPRSEVLAILRSVKGPGNWGPLAGAYIPDEDLFSFGVSDFYSKRYWVGPQEQREDVDPPEAGRIGTIQNRFEARLISRDDRTLVVVKVVYFEQQTGRRYKIFPHFHKGPVFADVKSDTYFEYLFLFKLGELLGEKGMPPLKGSPD